jgi:hypothetical protein
MYMDTVVDDKAIQRAFANAFGVDRDEVAIVDSLPEELKNKKPPRIIIERFVIEDKHPVHLSVYPIAVQTDRDEMETVRALCKELNTPCLVEDGTLDPSRYLRVFPDGKVELEIWEELPAEEMTGAYQQ